MATCIHRYFTLAMYIRHLSLHNYRNYVHLELDLDPRLNLFLGANAQGKTNLLEACHLLATARSHRTQRDNELVQWEQQGYHISAEVKIRHGTEHLSLRYDPQQGKKAQINGVLQPRLLDFVGQMKVVLFAPEHLSLVKGDPGQRRRFLDILLSQLYTRYLYELSQYQRVLREKGNLLKTPLPENTLLDVYNAQLAELGASLMRKRAEAVDVIAPLAMMYHKQLHPAECLKIRYQSQIELEAPYTQARVRDNLLQLMEAKRSEELRRRFCVVGLQRDDLDITLNGEDAKRFASQGQQRSIVLALKVAEAHYMDNVSMDRPILILDDLFSELDNDRQAHLLSLLQDFGQTLISAVSLPPVLHSKAKRIYRVQEGKVNLTER